MRPTHRRTLIAAGAAGAALLGAWALALGGAPLAAGAQEADAGASAIQPMVLGEEDAPVTMIEYASFTCPHCATFHEEVWPEIRRDYVDAGLVRFEYREVFFDRPGLWASLVARCGDGMRFFGVADLIYENQREWAAGQPAEIADGLRRIGRAAGLTDEALDACLSDGEMAQALVARSEEQAEADGVSATPSFVIDGELHRNMAPADLRALLDAKLEG